MAAHATTMDRPRLSLEVLGTPVDRARRPSDPNQTADETFLQLDPTAPMVVWVRSPAVADDCLLNVDATLGVKVDTEPGTGCMAVVFDLWDGHTTTTATRGWRDGDGGPVCGEDIGLFAFGRIEPGDALIGQLVVTPTDRPPAGSTPCPRSGVVCGFGLRERATTGLVQAMLVDDSIQACGRDPACFDPGNERWAWPVGCRHRGDPIPGLVRNLEALHDTGLPTEMRLEVGEPCCEGYRIETLRIRVVASETEDWPSLFPACSQGVFQGDRVDWETWDR